MAKFKKIKDRKIIMKSGGGPFPYHRNWLGKWVPKWHDFDANVGNSAGAKARVTKQTWAYEYHNSKRDAYYYTVNKKGYIPDGAVIVYEKGVDVYVIEKTLEKCTTGPLSAESMVITCNNTKKFFSDEKINKARAEYSELKKAREDIKQFSLDIDSKINQGYDGRIEIKKRMQKLNTQLNKDLTEYNKYYDKHTKAKNKDTTLKAMEEDVKLKDGSISAYYYVWLTLAISGLITVSIITRK